MRKLLIVCVCLLSLSATAAMSSVSLFQAKVAVKNRSQQVWRDGAKSALAQVLIKVTGNPDVNSLPQVKEAFSDVNALVQSYRYDNKALYGKVNQLFLRVQFDPSEIKQAIRDAGQHVWAGRRPSTLMWLAMQMGTDYGARTQILSRDQHAQYVTSLDSAAQRRGISVVLPTMDLTDISSISAKDVWSFNVPLLDEVSRRYNTDGFVIARISFDADQYWHANCEWVSGGNKLEWVQKQADLDTLISGVVDRLSNEMAAQSVSLRSQDQGQTMLVRVIGVNGIGEYTKVIDYLKMLTPVKDVQLESTESDSVILSVTFGGDEDNLNRAVVNAKAHRLSAIKFRSVKTEDPGVDENIKNIELMYQWQNS